VKMRTSAHREGKGSERNSGRLGRPAPLVGKVKAGKASTWLDEKRRNSGIYRGDED